ncbi:MAG: hypothetical protein Kow0026_27630 [Oricola sp.]
MRSDLKTVPEPARESGDSLCFSGVLRERAEAAKLKAERTRYRLLAAIAEELCAGVGRSGLKVAAVTARAGVAHGTFYRYFADIGAATETLIEAFSAFLRERLSSARAGPPGSRERVHATNLVYARLFAGNAALMRCLFALGEGDSAFARTYGELNRDWYQRMALAIARRRMAATGERMGPEEAVATAYALGGMADEFLGQIHLRREPALARLAADPEAVAGLLTELWCRGAYGTAAG